MEIVESNKELSDIEKAQLVLKEEKSNREKECFGKMQELLKEYNCDLTVVHSVNEQNQILSQINLYAK